MDTLFIPNEHDFRRWIREAVKECLESTPLKSALQVEQSQEEPLLTRKEIAGIFRISLVTLHDWMKRGLPQSQAGRKGLFPPLRSDGLCKTKEVFAVTYPAMDKLSCAAAANRFSGVSGCIGLPAKEAHLPKRIHDHPSKG